MLFWRHDEEKNALNNRTTISSTQHLILPRVFTSHEKNFFASSTFSNTSSSVEHAIVNCVRRENVRCVAEVTISWWKYRDQQMPYRVCCQWATLFIWQKSQSHHSLLLAPIVMDLSSKRRCNPIFMKALTKAFFNAQYIPGECSGKLSMWKRLRQKHLVAQYKRKITNHFVLVPLFFKACDWENWRCLPSFSVKRGDTPIADATCWSVFADVFVIVYSSLDVPPC